MNKDKLTNKQNRLENTLEAFFFNFRPLHLIIFAALTVFFIIQASEIKPSASFEKMIPKDHEYIGNFLEHKADLNGLGNAIRISVENTQGDIFNKEYQQVLSKIHDEVFYIPGVDRSALKSIWASGVRWMEVTEDGFSGGPVVGSDYNGSEQSLLQLRKNVEKSGQIGALVANNLKSAVIYAPLLEKDPETGLAIDYQVFSQRLETLIRDKYQTDTIKIHITGFAKVVGDLIDGLAQIAVFFAAALLITFVLLYLYSSCLRSALIPLVCSVIAVIWQLGLLKTLGFDLDPYSMLVPFLVFAIAVSHGVQIINAIAHESSNGADKNKAARLAFKALYLPGLIALISDGVGFATLMVIEIEVIQDLAIAASLGVAVIILSNLVLLPILMSYAGVSAKSVQKQIHAEEHGKHRVWNFLASFTAPKRAKVIIYLTVVVSCFGVFLSQDLQTGDLDSGAPELRPDSRYNLDNAFITENYRTSTDIFVVMVKTPQDQCANYLALDAIDQLQSRLNKLPGVQSTTSLVDKTKRIMSGNNEGNIKWYALNRNQVLLDQASIRTPESFNSDCSLVPLFVYLNDHKAQTLTTVVEAVEEFAAEFNRDELIFKLAAGNSGIEAATNIVIEESQYKMLFWVYGVVGFLCLVTFRSIRTVLCIIIPLAITSLLCQALMAQIGIGVKVATLPVIALGVGIGVDYGIYIYTKLLTYLDEGKTLRDAYFNTLKTTGKAVAFTGITLGIGVGTWFFSPIKFQADMGILLTFMFIWNMFGALVMIPALTCLINKKVVKNREHDHTNSKYIEEVTSVIEFEKAS
ncbi:MMPL family transporter [Thalassotalea nanhaiensis]|uniref:MMPL family transporter n=1 Tax=Thalassotalea nanhaiensis TaxID=3065648 RepID=A0ABY9TD98_9GAMM|nr:MMPL family transporter [Colwelliaceae bacterium SQ345]